MKTSKKIATTLVTLPVILLLAGCGISAGTVSQKVVEPEHTYTQMISCGKACLVPIQQTDDEDYCFTIIEGEDNNYICVEKAEWDSISEGDYYSQ
jgi:hypothetical protein